MLLWLRYPDFPSPAVEHLPSTHEALGSILKLPSQPEVMAMSEAQGRAA